MEVDGEYQIWPYTSKSESVEGRTLAINVVFRDDGEAVREALEARPDADWQETDDEETDAEPDLVRDIVVRDWEDAHGSTRYTYFEGPSGGAWVTESFELHDGEYLGSRDHIRAYESPDERTPRSRSTRSTTTGSDSVTPCPTSTTRRSGSKTTSSKAASASGSPGSTAESTAD